MANCPTCKTDWKWDWSQDVLRQSDGTQATQTTATFVTAANEEKWMITAMRCSCGRVLAITNIDKFGAMTFNPDEWKSVDWEQPEHAYDEASEGWVPEVTDYQFAEYLRCRDGGQTNMFDVKRVTALTGLTREQVLYIMENCKKLQDFFTD